MSSHPSSTVGPGLVAVVAYDGLCTFEFGIAVEIFGLPRPEFDFPWYDFRVVSAEGNRVRAVGGIDVCVDGGLRILSRARTIIVPGWREPSEQPPQALCRAIARAHASGARCLSICSGVFVLAAAGVLSGRRATTHWRHLDTLQRAYPDIAVVPDVLYVDEGSTLTSAGSAAGIDACLHLVRRDFGRTVVNAVARRLVLAPHRDAGQAQFVSAPVPRLEGRSIAKVMDWALERMAEPISVADLARQANVSHRTLLRRFHDAIGMAPLEWLQRERIRRSQELLETSELPLERVADACGFRSYETFRGVFRKTLGVSPRRYAHQFRAG